MDQATINLYRQKFDDLLTKKYFVLNTELKYWYKQKFKWRLTFRGLELTRFDNYKTYKSMKRTFNKLDASCRTRVEYTLSVFTNSSELLDFVLDNEEYRNQLIQVTHVDMQYENEIMNLDGVAVDVKFQSPKRFNPEIKYLIEFSWDFGLDRSITGVVLSHNRKEKYKELYDYCMANSDTLIPNITLTAFGHNRFYYSGPPQIWVKDEAQIPLIYVMFGHIYKVWKLVKKEKNNEQ